MAALTNDNLAVFNRADRVVEGWYWALPAADVKPGTAHSVNLMGRELAIYKTESGQLVALDAHCRHRGAHLGLGTVQGDCISCPYHRWTYDSSGKCVDVPVLDEPPASAHVQAWPVREKYGLVWVYTGKHPKSDIISVPELHDQETSASLGGRYTLACHPNVVMCDAIDVQHFESVHRIGYLLDMTYSEVEAGRMEFRNQRHAPADSAIGRLLRTVYKGPVTYSLNYHNGMMGTVTLGPDALHFHTLFANRLGPNGTTEGQIVVITKKRRGVKRLLSRVALEASKAVVSYFGIGDTPNFNSMRMNFEHPVKADKQLIAFINHVEGLPLADWGYGARTSAKPETVALVG